MPLQGEIVQPELKPRALPWAESRLALRAAVATGIIDCWCNRYNRIKGVINGAINGAIKGTGS